MTMTGLDIAGATDPGCVRPNNEDNFVVEDSLGLLVVADGMGGHNSGEVASELAEPDSDLHASADYRRHLVGVLTERALRRARETARA